MHRLHAVDWGSRRNARVVVCVHGYSGNARDFDFLARELACEARVVCPDIAGRGRSAWLPTPLAYGLPQFISDLRMLLAQIGAERVDWIGTSMGGLLGLLLASQPDSPIGRLVLNDVGAFVPAGALRAIGRNLHAPRRFDSLDALRAHMRHTHREWGPVTDEQWAHLVRHSARRIAGGGYALHYDPQIARVMELPVVGSGLSLWPAWHRVRCPVLVIRGESSRILPRDVARAMLAAKPDARLVEVAGAGHVPSLMAPEQAAFIRDFLGASRAELKRAA